MAEGQDKKGGKGECVKVVVRARPLSSKEIAAGNTKIVDLDLQRGVAVLHKPGGGDRDSKDFTFDAVYDERMTQQQIFEDTGADILESVMDGFNGTIFAYGQTGAGKSHTMTGPKNCGPDLEGLLPRAFKYIFSKMESSSTAKQWMVRGSYIEIYNEEVRDLLSKNPKEKCDLKDHPNSGVYVKDLTGSIVKSFEEMQNLLDVGLQNRMVGATQMNDESSRSHSIFMVTVEQSSKGADGDDHIRVGKLNMVDLAGSERQSKTGATGERLKEATKINLSLSALGNVISALVDGKSSHIPYRDSKLTRLLQDSLGGNTKTVMVANIGPADYNFDETLSTLRYAYRAKSIKNKPRINEDPKDAMIREFQEEIMRLKEQLGPDGGGMPGAGGDGGMGYPGMQQPRVEKQVEYVEKVVEKTIEKEVIVNAGARPEELYEVEQKLRERNDQLKMEADMKRQEIESQLHVAAEEKQHMLASIEQEEQIAMQELQRKAEIEAKLKAMEHNMVKGKQFMEKAIEQEEELKKKQRELKKQLKSEEKLKQEEEKQRQENLFLEEKCATQEEQVQKLTAKLQKLWDRYQKAQQEMIDVQQFNQNEREELLGMIRELRHTLKLKTLIMESFVPVKEIQNTQERAVWDAEEEEWRLQPPRVDKENRPVRPGSAVGLPRPTSEFTRINRNVGDPSPRYMYDCIMMTDLDLPERTTEDYEVHPELGERIERALLLALSADDDGAGEHNDAGDPAGDARKAKSERPSTGRKDRRPSSGRPTTGRMRAEPAEDQPAFPQARGLVSRE